MRDAEAQSVQQRVERYLHSARGQGFDIGKGQCFEALLGEVRAALSSVEEDDLRVVTAMCLLGPEFSGIPPAALREDLLALVRRLVPNEEERVKRIMEFAIAYGCGKWRVTTGGLEGWDQRWEGAVLALMRALEPAVEQANRWLAERVVGFPQARHVPHLANFPQTHDVGSDTHLLALRLMEPERLIFLKQGQTMRITCEDDGTALEVPAQDYQEDIPPGARAVWTVATGGAALALSNRRRLALPTGTKAIITARDDDARIEASGGTRDSARLRIGETAQVTANEAVQLAIWACTCGTTGRWANCMEQHRLEAWKPTEVSLWTFLASAVKGPQRTIQTGSFVQGMYFPLLARDGIDGMRLRLAPVEYKHCATDGTAYEGKQCTQCRQSFAPETDKRVMRDLLILVGVDPPAYVREARFCCSNQDCRNLYAARQCPLCGRSRPQRPTIVWLRTFTIEESLEEFQPGGLGNGEDEPAPSLRGTETEETEEVDDDDEESSQ